jgi:phosphoglycerate dehydrogenase-like enzyme
LSPLPCPTSNWVAPPWTYSPSSPLRKPANGVLTPHIGWKIDEVFHEFAAIAADQFAACLNSRLAEEEVLTSVAARPRRERML